MWPSLWLLLFLLLISFRGDSLPRRISTSFLCTSVVSSTRTRVSPGSVAVVVAAKGKTRRVKRGDKKPDLDDDNANETSDDQSNTPRVSSQINIPVRRQIAIARQWKKLMKEGERPVVVQKNSKNRKKKTGNQKDAIASDYPNFDPEIATTILLVDGYNLINHWSKTIKARSVGGMPEARKELLEQLRYLYHARHWKIVVAYDEKTPGRELRVLEGDIDEVYTGESESADSYIERRATELCSKRGGPTVKVATNDRAIQVVSASSGAEMMSTSSLIKEIYVARKELIYRRTGEDWRTKKAVEDALEYFDED